MNKRIYWIPVAAFFLLSPFTPFLDLGITRIFYKLGEGTVEHFVVSPFYEFLYDWGTFPAVLVGFISACMATLSYLFRRFKKWRRDSLFLVLVLTVGPVFLVNTVLKDHWGRPRPKQVIEFGGTQEYRPWYYPNFLHQPIPSKSFPCGHCAMGFFFLAFAVLGLRHHNKFLIIGGSIVGISYGLLIGLARIAQGGHFFSDVLATGVIIWVVALAIDEYVMPYLE